MGFTADSLRCRPGNSVIDELGFDGAVPSGRRSVLVPLPSCKTGVPVWLELLYRLSSASNRWIHLTQSVSHTGRRRLGGIPLRLTPLIPLDEVFIGAAGFSAVVLASPAYRPNCVALDLSRTTFTTCKNSPPPCARSRLHLMTRH